MQSQDGKLNAVFGKTFVKVRDNKGNQVAILLLGETRVNETACWYLFHKGKMTWLIQPDYQALLNQVSKIIHQKD